LQWACQQTYTELLALVIATGEKKGMVWDYDRMDWRDKS
jgi:hypothetical protein